MASTATVKPNLMVTESCLSLFRESHTPQQTSTRIKEIKNSTNKPCQQLILGFIAGEQIPVPFMFGFRYSEGVTACKFNIQIKLTFSFLNLLII